MRRWVLRTVLAAAALRWLGPARMWAWPRGQRHPWRVPARTVFIGDEEYLVRQTGPTDGPDVVLVHGLGGSSLAEWFAVGPLLARSHRVTMVDVRNHGLSHQSTDRFEVADLADDVAAVVQAAGVRRATVAGYSMGGAVVQSLAHRHPRLVGRLVLIGSFTTHPHGWRWGRRIGVWVIRAWERVTGVGTPEFRAAYLLATGAVPMSYARWLWGEANRRDIEGGYQSTFSLFRFDSGDWVGRIDAPALVVIPGRDQLVPVAWQYRLAAALRDCRVLELPDARHEAPMTHADRIAGAIVDFIGAVDREASGPG